MHVTYSLDTSFRERTDLDEAVAVARDWLIAHADWIGPVVGAIAFGESLPVIGILLPGATFLIAAGSLIPMGIVSGWTMIAWIIPGAILGDVIAYWLGQKYGSQILALWPMRNHPDLIEQGYRFFNRWGTASVFFGRFSGPVRSTVPLLAGMMNMPRGRFWFANVASAVTWAPFLMSPGYVFAIAAKWYETASALERLLGGLALVNLAVGGFFLWRWLRRRTEKASGEDADRLLNNTEN